MTEPDDDLRVLAERARLLAAPRTEPGPQEPLALIECRLGPERYGLRLEAVREIAHLDRFAPLPCTPPHVAGMTNLRGTVLPVLDLRPVMGLSPAPPPAESVIVVVSWGSDACGLLFDRADGVRTLDKTDLLPPPSRAGGVQARYVEGATRDGLLLLDLAALSADEGLVVAEEPAASAIFATDILHDERRTTTHTPPTDGDSAHGFLVHRPSHLPQAPARLRPPRPRARGRDRRGRPGAPRAPRHAAVD
ncbi:MAG: chemotaxis protein CheW [Methanospirillum sp.]